MAPLNAQGRGDVEVETPLSILVLMSDLTWKGKDMLTQNCYKKTFVLKETIYISSQEQFFITFVNNFLDHLDILTPKNPQERGCQLSVVFR